MMDLSGNSQDFPDEENLGKRSSHVLHRHDCCNSKLMPGQSKCIPTVFSIR